MNALLPYPTLETVFIQRLGGTALGRYPEESVQIQVPPSTHFGYTFEWGILAVVTLTAGFLLQAFPFRNPYRTQTAKLDHPAAAHDRWARPARASGAADAVANPFEPHRARSNAMNGGRK